MNRVLFVAVILGVAGLIGWALSVVGGPGFARLEAQDSQRVKDLNALVAYVTCDDVDTPLPASLPEDGHCKHRAQPEHLNDRITGAPYVYRRLSDDVFEVCAQFATQTAFHTNAYDASNLRVREQEGCFGRKRQSSDWVSY